MSDLGTYVRDSVATAPLPSASPEPSAGASVGPVTLPLASVARRRLQQIAPALVVLVIAGVFSSLAFRLANRPGGGGTPMAVLAIAILAIFGIAVVVVRYVLIDRRIPAALRLDREGFVVVRAGGAEDRYAWRDPALALHLMVPEGGPSPPAARIRWQFGPGGRSTFRAADAATFLAFARAGGCELSRRELPSPRTDRRLVIYQGRTGGVSPPAAPVPPRSPG